MQDTEAASKTTNAVPAEQYDLAQDLNLPLQNEQQDLINKEIEDEEYRAKLRCLNKEQLHVLYHVLHHIQISDQPICHFLTGGAGVGKTFVLKLLYQAMLKYYNKQPGTDPGLLHIMLTAPTGKAAYLLRGNTLHLALKIPINQKLEFKSLDNDSLNTLRTQMASTKVIFIDEISMVGVRLFSFIHKRLQEIRLSSQPFGGISIIACGDLFQLQPVCDSYIFQQSHNGYGPLACNLWQDNFEMTELHNIMR